MSHFVKKILKGASEGLLAFIANIIGSIGVLLLMMGVAVQNMGTIQGAVVMILISVIVKGIVIEFIHS